MASARSAALARGLSRSSRPPPPQGPPLPLQPSSGPRLPPAEPPRPAAAAPAAAHPEMFRNSPVSDPFRTQQRSVLAAPLGSVPVVGAVHPLHPHSPCTPATPAAPTAPAGSNPGHPGPVHPLRPLLLRGFWGRIGLCIPLSSFVPAREAAGAAWCDSSWRTPPAMPQHHHPGQGVPGGAAAAPAPWRRGCWEPEPEVGAEAAREQREEEPTVTAGGRTETALGARRRQGRK